MSTARLHLRRGIPIGDRGPMIVCRPSNRGGRAVGIECRRYPRMAHRAHPRHGRREARQKQLRFRAVLNFSRRHCLKIESLAPPAARLQSSANKHCLKGRKPVRGAKESFLEAKPACASSGIKDGQRRINFIDGHFRPKSAKIRMQIRMHFWFRRAGSVSMPTGSRAEAGFHRRAYALLCTVCSSP